MMLAGAVSVQPWEEDEREMQREQEDYRNVKMEGKRVGNIETELGRWMERQKKRDARGKETI